MYGFENFLTLSGEIMESPNNSTSKQRLFPKWFTIWFLLSCVLMLFGGILDEMGDQNPTGSNAWGAGISMFVMYLFVLFVWRNRAPFQEFCMKSPGSFLVKTLVLGWVIAEIDELVCFPFNALFPGATLLQDVVLTTPMYLCAYLGWFWVLKRYRFSVQESFYVGGLSIGVIELIAGGAAGMVILAGMVWPFLAMIHGCHMIMPRIALAPYFESLEQRETRWKYPIGIMVPIFGTGVGIGFAALLGPLFFDLK